MAGQYQKKRQPKKRILPVWLLLLLVLLTTGGIGTTVAKYIHSSNGKLLLKAPEFYFTSDLLTADTENYVLNSRTKQVTFTLSDKADTLRASDDPVNYTITTTGGTLSSASGTLKNQTVEVTLRDLQPGVTYRVEATGKAGYTKKLSATFRVSDTDEDVYKHLEVSGDGYMILTVWTHNVTGTMSVVFPAELIPDNTNTHMGSVYNIDDSSKNSFAAGNWGKYSSQTYRFFYNGGAYSADHFTISVTDNDKTYPAVTADLP